MSKIEKSDSLFSLGEKIWEYKVYLVLGMSFISSLFAPVVLVFGWPATIIIITSLTSSSVLLMLLFWKEFNSRREIIKEEKANDMKLNYEREQKMDEILLELPSSNQARQAILYAKCRILYRHLPESKKNIIEQVAKASCGENVGQEQKSMIYTLLEKFEPFRDNVNLLTPKIIEAIKSKSISKQSIEFLSSITDLDLEILKGQFRYVLQLPNQDYVSDHSSKDLAIWRFENKTLTTPALLLKEQFT